MFVQGGKETVMLSVGETGECCLLLLQLPSAKTLEPLYLSVAAACL